MRDPIDNSRRRAIPVLGWLRERRPRVPSPEPVPRAPEGILRALRAAALWAIGALIAVADGAAFTESYRGLYEWALHHHLSGFWAAAFPLQVDVFIVVGELVLLVAMIDRWGWRERLGAWAVALLGVAVSVAGNIGHIAARDAQSRGTAAIPPVAAFAALWLGLAVLKRVLARLAERAPAAAPQAAALEPLPQAAQVPSSVPSSAEAAAEASMRATLAAGNPWSVNALATKFGLSRQQATEVRDRVMGAAARPAPGPRLLAAPCGDYEPAVPGGPCVTCDRSRQAHEFAAVNGSAPGA